MTVPIDYWDPRTGSLDLALIRRPASDPGQRIGSLLVNPGGPGASGVARVRRGFVISAEVADRFDIVGFDPRGVGDSAPLSCGATVDAFRSHDLGPDTPAETAALERAARAVADECARTEGARLAHLGTASVVHDVEMIRRALGEPTVSFVGLSYGTLVGLLWAEAYPTSVRALVLDGVADPAGSSTAVSGHQVDGIDRVFTTMGEACDNAPSCPLHDDGGLASAYDELARRIDTGAVQVAGVGPTQLAYAVFSATYSDARWPMLWEAIDRGLRSDLRGVSDMARWFTGLVDYPSFALISCLDAPHAMGADAWRATTDEMASRSSRFGRIAGNELLPCAFWPAATHRPHRVTASGAPTVLVIGSTGDAATPYDQAVAVADDLSSARLLTVERAGHVAIDRSPCVDDVVSAYLAHLTVPPDGTRC